MQIFRTCLWYPNTKTFQTFIVWLTIRPLKFSLKLIVMEMERLISTKQLHSKYSREKEVNIKVFQKCLWKYYQSCSRKLKQSTCVQMSLTYNYVTHLSYLESSLMPTVNLVEIKENFGSVDANMDGFVQPNEFDHDLE